MPIVDKFGLPGRAIEAAAYDSGFGPGLLEGTKSAQRDRQLSQRDQQLAAQIANQNLNRQLAARQQLFNEQIQRRQLEQRDESLIAGIFSQERSHQASIEQLNHRAKLQRNEYSFELSEGAKAKQQEIQAKRMRLDEARAKGEINDFQYEDVSRRLLAEELGIEKMPKEQSEFPVGKGIGDSWEEWNPGNEDGPADRVMTRDPDGKARMVVDLAKQRLEERKVEVQLQVKEEARTTALQTSLENARADVEAQRQKQREYVSGRKKSYETVNENGATRWASDNLMEVWTEEAEKTYPTDFLENEFRRIEGELGAVPIPTLPGGESSIQFPASPQDDPLSPPTQIEQAAPEPTAGASKWLPIPDNQADLEVGKIYSGAGGIPYVWTGRQFLKAN